MNVVNLMNVANWFNVVNMMNVVNVVNVWLTIWLSRYPMNHFVEC